LPGKLPLKVVGDNVLLLHDLFSRTSCVSLHQKGETSLDLNEARDDGVWGRQWHQLDHMQTICTSLQTDNHMNTSALNFAGWMLFLTPNQRCQSTEGKIAADNISLITSCLVHCV